MSRFPSPPPQWSASASLPEAIVLCCGTARRNLDGGTAKPIIYFSSEKYIMGFAVPRDASSMKQCPLSHTSWSSTPIRSSGPMGQAG